jgi:hypothetical protein
VKCNGQAWVHRHLSCQVRDVTCVAPGFAWEKLLSFSDGDFIANAGLGRGLVRQ